MIFVFCLFLSNVAQNVDGNKFNRFDPLLSAEFYVGRIKENEEILRLDPILNATDPDGFICGFELSKFKHDVGDPSTNDEVPFKIDENGLITVKNPIDCEEKQMKKFFVRAFDCATGENRRFSERSTIFVQVEDVNEFSPVFTHDEYSFKVFQDQNCSSCRVEAVDDDCSNDEGQVCGYKILEENLPFQIDSNGTIRIERSLNEDVYQFRVAAVDCQTNFLDQTNTARVTIKKISQCKPKLYDPQATKLFVDSDHTHIFETTHLEICDETCSIDWIDTRLELETNELDVLCQIDQCQVNFREFFLLDGKFDERSEPFFVEKEKFSAEFNNDFLVRFSMKLSHENLDEKEQIFCLSDEKMKNRHHLSLFVENDRLKLLIRKFYSSNFEQTKFPSEWSWKIATINDEKWHSYKIFVDYPTRIDLFIDEEIVSSNQSDFRVVFDHGLAPIKETGGPVLVVGGCWHARAGRIVDEFSGELSSISIEQSSKSSCFHKCNEFIEISDHEENPSVQNFSSNVNRSELFFRTDSVENFENLLKHVVYRNVLFPLGPEGQRTISVRTTIKCLGENSTTILKPFSRRLSIDENLQPVEIQLKGDSNILINDEELRFGVEIFFNLSIFSADLKKNRADITDCSITTSPEISPDETLVIPDENGGINNLQISRTKTGLILSGDGSIDSYQSILRQIIYVSKSPVDFDFREFSLVCIGAHDQVSTNEVRIRLEIDRRFSESGVALKSSQLFVENEFMIENAIDLDGFGKTTTRFSAWPMVIVVLVSIGLAGTLILFLIVRIRHGDFKRRSFAAGPDELHSQMEWEDEIDLKIIVNPLDEEKPIDELQSRLNDEQNDSDEDENENQEEIDSSDDEDQLFQATNIQHQLEWDDATVQNDLRKVSLSFR